MNDSKLIELLSCFSTSELKRLKQMADSPFFNNQEPIRKLLDFLLDFAPNFEHPKMSYRNAFQYIYGDRAIQSDPQTAVAKVMSKLIALVKGFIIQIEMEDQPVQCALYQANFFRKKQLLDYVPKLLDEAESITEESHLRNEYYFRHKMLIEFERSTYLNIIQDKLNLDYNLTKHNSALDHYYTLSKLQTYCVAKNVSSHNNFQFDFSQMATFLTWLESSAFLENFSIHIWYLALCLLNAPSLENYHALKQMIYKHEKALGAPVIRVLYSYLSNKAKLLYKDREVYFKEMLDLYKEQIELKALYINGYLSPAMLRNITIVGIKRGEFDWVESFLESNADKIVPTYLEREDIIVLCRAYLYFEKGEFNHSLEMINALRYDNVFTKMDERRLRLMCYFEMGIRDPFDDLINSFRKFLTDHKKRIPPNHLEANRLFIHFIHKIATSNHQNRKQHSLLTAEIEQIPVLPEKEWLLAKVGKEHRL